MIPFYRERRLHAIEYSVAHLLSALIPVSWTATSRIRVGLGPFGDPPSTESAYEQGYVWGGALHNGGWANGMAVPLPPPEAGAPVPIVLALMRQTSYTAGGTNSFAVLFLNAPLSEARGRIRVVRVSDSVIIATSGWTGTLDNRVTITGLVVGTTDRVQVELQALVPAWVSVPWTTMIASYVQPSKNDPLYEWEFQTY